MEKLKFVAGLKRVAKRGGLARFALALVLCGVVFTASGRDAAVEAQAPGPVEVVSISLYPEGFWPSQLKIRRGPFLLAVDDRTGLDQVLLRVEAERGNALATASVPAQAAHWDAMADLPVGVYRIRELNHPDWLCELTVTP